MGWHIGMTYEEMEKEFGNGSKGDSATNGDSGPTACPLPTNPDGSISSKPPAPPEEHQHVYHLCREQDWKAAKESQTPYFPRTFLKDGKFTRASLYLDDIVDVANEYYSTASPADEKWIVLQLDVQFLYNGLGIAVLATTAPESTSVQCLQVFGGISTKATIVDSLVTAVYSMKRRDLDGKFIGMQASVDESIGPVSPRKPMSPKQTNCEEEAEAEDDTAESSKQEEPVETEKENTTKTKKKKKGLFSKLKAKK